MEKDEKLKQVSAYLAWVESHEIISPIPSTPKRKRSNDYSSHSIQEIFSDALPQEMKTPERGNDLFSAPKKADSNVDDWFILNSMDIQLSPDEGYSLNGPDRKHLEKMLSEQHEIFGEITTPISNIEHQINTGTHKPISNPPYRISPARKIQLKAEIDDMLEKGIIEEKHSPWAFPVVMVPKKDGQIRVCVDYRKLNAITIPDRYPLPRMDDLLHAAKSTPYMSTLDLRSGYWQIKVAEEDRLKTAFITPFGSYVFKRMPFGLRNAPATFQRLIDKFRNGLPQILILAYLDDIIICSENFSTHLNDLQTVFERLKQFGFKLNRDKCRFCCSEIKYLGHILTPDGFKVDPEKTDAILLRPSPKNQKQVLSFLQTCSWYRRFIPNFADISKPLSNLTKKNVIWKWGIDEQNAFDKLKKLLTTSPILQQVKDDIPLILKTDASSYAIGAVLLQGENEMEHPVEFASRLLLPAERNYSTTEREALAVVWAVEKFRGYIEGSEVKILTDHQPLKWLMSLKSPTGRLARWALQLQPYNIEIGYNPGRNNAVADTLSRPPCPDNDHTEDCIICSVLVDIPRTGSKEIRDNQLADFDLKLIIDSFENNDENLFRWTSRGYMLVDGVLYRYCSDAVLP